MFCLRSRLVAWPLKFHICWSVAFEDAFLQKLCDSLLGVPMLCVLALHLFNRSFEFIDDGVSWWLVVASSCYLVPTVAVLFFGIAWLLLTDYPILLLLFSGAVMLGSFQFFTSLLAAVLF